MEANLPWRKTTSWQTLPSPCHPKSRNPPQQLETLETSEVREEPSTWWINKALYWIQHQETYSPYPAGVHMMDGDHTPTQDQDSGSPLLARPGYL